MFPFAPFAYFKNIFKKDEKYLYPNLVVNIVIPIFGIQYKNKTMTTLIHHTFGKGTIVTQDDNTITINFNGVEKRLVTKFAGLTYEDGSLLVAEEVKAPKKKKLNRANFMSDEEFNKSEYSKMSKSDYEEMRKRDMWASKSF